jgi:hypothetical protein
MQQYLNNTYRLYTSVEHSILLVAVYYLTIMQVIHHKFQLKFYQLFEFVVNFEFDFELEFEFGSRVLQQRAVRVCRIQYLIFDTR